MDEYENHPESDTYRPSQVFYNDTVDLNQDHKDFIRYFSDMTDYRDTLQICFYELLSKLAGGLPRKHFWQNSLRASM